MRTTAADGMVKQG